MNDEERALYRKIYGQSVHTVKDFKKPANVGAKFMVVIDDSYSCMGADYGPPDPPPSMETHNTIRVVMLHDEAEVASWVKNHTESKGYGSPKAYQILKVDPVTISTSISVSIG
ncbi:hypothetical protein D3C75_720170 [compost metagenome]